MVAGQTAVQPDLVTLQVRLQPRQRQRSRREGNYGGLAKKINRLAVGGSRRWAEDHAYAEQKLLGRPFLSLYAEKPTTA